MHRFAQQAREISLRNVSDQNTSTMSVDFDKTINSVALRDARLLIDSDGWIGNRRSGIESGISLGRASEREISSDSSAMHRHNRRFSIQLIARFNIRARERSAVSCC